MEELVMGAAFLLFLVSSVFFLKGKGQGLARQRNPKKPTVPLKNGRR